MELRSCLLLPAQKAPQLKSSTGQYVMIWYYFGAIYMAEPP